VDRQRRGSRGARGGGARAGPRLSDLLAFLERLPPGPLYGLITALAALENFIPPLPADTAVALGAFLAGRGRLHLWTVFGLTWGANVASASLVYWLARRYGRDFFKGPTGRRLLTPPVLAHIEAQYQRHGTYGIFVSRLLPVWRAVVPPFAGIAGLSAPRALIPLALASALWYGLLTVLVATLGTNLDAVVAVLAHVNWVLGATALGVLIFLPVWIVRRLKR
jgi:membrane protein DedA with SNARE-associated domain